MDSVNSAMARRSAIHPTNETDPLASVDAVPVSGWDFSIAMLINMVAASVSTLPSAVLDATCPRAQRSVPQSPAE
jgi:hypothetical protein